MIKFAQVEMKRKKNKLIISNGSERSDFIPVSHIFSQMGRIHDGIQLMKTYYPNDEMWSTTNKISEMTQKKGVNYAWDYEYEDYHPFDIWEEGSGTLKEIEQIKQYGSDLHLTLTLDLSLSDKEIEQIVRSLNPFGRVYLRINHEANGFWFRYNTQHTYKEVSDFFVRCHKIIKSTSSNIYTVFNLTVDAFTVKNDYLHLASNELLGALKIADYWSLDKYTSLHYGWPFEENLTENSTSFFTVTVDDWWHHLEETYLKMIWHNDLVAKPLFINEFNSDSNVDGYDGQASIISSVYNRLSGGEFEWIEGIVLYQFRDYGGLGLEKGNINEYVELSSLSAYRDAIANFKYDSIVSGDEWKFNDYTFFWPDSDNMRGLCIYDLQGKDSFKNGFNFPVFVVNNDGTVWNRLESGEVLQINGMEGITLLVPPYKKANGEFSYSTIIRNVKSKIEDMIE